MKTATLRLDGDGLRLAATTGSGHQFVVDDAEGGSGPRPTELLLVALVACTAMDVISILRKKRQVVEDYAVNVEGVQRTEHPKAFTHFNILHTVRGPVDPAAVRRAIELSATRYCAVSATLSSGGADIGHTFRVERPDGVATGEVSLIGPYRKIEEPPPA